MRASCSSDDRAQMRGRFEMMIMKSRKIHIYRAKEGMYFWRWNRMEGGVYGQSPDHGTSTLHTNLLAALRFMCFLCGPKHFLQYNCCLHCWEFVECRVCFTCFTLGFPCSITIKPYKKNANWLSLLCANSEKHLLMRHIMTVRLLWTFVASHIRTNHPHAFCLLTPCREDALLARRCIVTSSSGYHNLCQRGGSYHFGESSAVLRQTWIRSRTSPEYLGVLYIETGVRLWARTTCNR